MSSSAVVHSTPRDATRVSVERDADIHVGPPLESSTHHNLAAPLYVFSNHALHNPRRFSAHLQSTTTHTRAPHDDAHEDGNRHHHEDNQHHERTGRRLGPPPGLAAPPAKRQRWCWRCPYILPSALARPSPATTGAPRRGQEKQLTPPPTTSPTTTSRDFSVARSSVRQDATSAACTLCTGEATQLLRDLQQQVRQLQACVERLQVHNTAANALAEDSAALPRVVHATSSLATTAVSANASAADLGDVSVVPPHECTVSEGQPPECDRTLGWASTVSVQAALPSPINAIPEAEGEAPEERASAAATPAASVAPAILIDALTHGFALLPLPSSAPDLHDADSAALARLREYFKHARHVGEEEGALRELTEGICNVDSASSPSPAATPTSTSTPTPMTHSDETNANPSGAGVRAGGLPVLNARALTHSASDVAVAVAADRQLVELRRRKSWRDAVEAAGRHVFVEGDDGRPVTAVKQRVVLVASPAISPLKLRPTAEAGVQPRHGKHPMSDPTASVLPPSSSSVLVSTDGAFSMLDVYMWHLQSPSNAKGAAAADARGPSASAGGVENDTSLLMASAASVLRPSLATTMTNCALPGEDRGVHLTSPSEAAAAPPPEAAAAAAAAAATTGDSPAEELPLPPFAEAGVQEREAYAIDQLREASALRVGEDGEDDAFVHVVAHDSVDKAAERPQMPAPAVESQREFFPPLVASTVATGDNSHGDVSDGAVVHDTEDTAGPARAQKKRALTLPPPLENAPAGFEKAHESAHVPAAHETGARPTTSHARSRKAAPRPEMSVGTGSSYLSSASPINPITAIPSAPPSSVAVATPSAPSHHQRRVLSCTAVELPEVRATLAITMTTSTPTASTAVSADSVLQEHSEWTEPPCGHSTGEPSPQLLQQVSAYQVLVEPLQATPPPRNNDGVETTTPSRLPHSAEKAAVSTRVSKPMLAVAPTITTYGETVAGHTSEHPRGSASAATRPSITISTADLSAPSGLSATNLMSGVFSAERGGGAAAASSPPVQGQISFSNVPADVAEAVGHNVGSHGERRRSSEVSWLARSNTSPNCLLQRPGAPSPAATPLRHAPASSASSPTSHRTPLPPPAPRRRQSASQKDKEEADAPTRGAPPAAGEPSPIAADGPRVSPALCMPPLAVKSAASAQSTATPGPASAPCLPVVSAGRAATAPGTMKWRKLDAQKEAAANTRGVAGTIGSPSPPPPPRTGGTSVLTTGQFRTGSSCALCGGAAPPPLRIASAPPRNESSLRSASLLSTSAGALRTPTGVPSGGLSSSPMPAKKDFASP